MPHDPAIENWLKSISQGDRRALARAITLVESLRAGDQALADQLLGRLPPDGSGSALRIGISGTPGVGKSTFIESFGEELIARGHRVAVLAIDPSGKRSGGSILGDKTRMERLARNPSAFIRPSPSQGNLGGVARRTREAARLVEAAGYDRIIVETVGVGQSEVAVAELVDLFMLLAGPAGGDDLQGIKRGIMELADIIVVTKHDGVLKAPAMLAAADLQSALHLMRPKYRQWTIPVIPTSALSGEGLDKVVETVNAFYQTLQQSGDLANLRIRRRIDAFYNEIELGLMRVFLDNAERRAAKQRLELDVAEGRLDPSLAARRLLEL
jgi:LAO/AO transport system kinase